MTRPSTCERAREWISLALDGELSRFEEAVLVAHVGHCAECEEFRAEVGEATLALRRAELERPARSLRVFARHRSLPRLVEPVAGIAVSVALVLGGFSASLQLGRDGDGVSRRPTSDVVGEVDAMRDYQRLQREIRIEETLGPAARLFQRPAGMQLPLAVS